MPICTGTSRRFPRACRTASSSYYALMSENGVLDVGDDIQAALARDIRHYRGPGAAPGGPR